jgi:MFS transporter, PAT family, beta-lactamase induction signal transducer AmpG
VPAPIRRAAVHPVVFLILFLPMGITNGYVVVTLGYLLSHAGVSVAAVASLVAVSLSPHMIKLLWAPLVDTTLTSKKWFFLSSLIVGLFMAATSIIPNPSANLWLVNVLVFAFSLASTFNTMAADNLMAHATLPEEKGRAGGWSQAGNLGGSGLGGGAGLWLAQHVQGDWIVGGTLGAVCILSSLAVYYIKEPVAAHRDARYIRSLLNVGKDVWQILRGRTGFLALVLMSLPIGVGAAQNLWAAVAGDWKASADTVALVTGAISGVISMFGCVAGGFVCDKLDRKNSYNLFGFALALCVVAMALSPRTEMMYIVFTSVYAFILGMCYAAFGAVVLEAIGKGAAATKYNLFAGLANVPIGYLTVMDGWGQGKWGSGGMLYVEALAGVAAIGLFYLVVLAARVLFGRAQPVQSSSPSG